MRSASSRRSEERRVGGADAARALDRLDDDRGDVALDRPSARSTPSGSPHGSSTTRPETASGTPGVPATAVSWVPW